MPSNDIGKNTSTTEVSNISGHGIWLLTGNRELFLSFEDYPWFISAPIGKILHVTEPHPGHYYWPELDIDLSLDRIEHPELYPLKAK